MPALAFARLTREPGARVEPSLCETLRLARALGDRSSMAWALEGLACVAARDRDWHRAGVLLGAAAALRQASGVPTAPVAVARIQEAAAATRAALSTGAEAAWVEGRRLAAGELEAFACPAEPLPSTAPPSPAAGG